VTFGIEEQRVGVALRPLLELQALDKLIPQCGVSRILQPCQRGSSEERILHVECGVVQAFLPPLHNLAAFHLAYRMEFSINFEANTLLRNPVESTPGGNPQDNHGNEGDPDSLGHKAVQMCACQDNASLQCAPLFTGVNHASKRIETAIGQDHELNSLGLVEQFANALQEFPLSIRFSNHVHNIS